MATLRQKKAFSKVLENGGIVSRAMSESGYSPATAKNPDKLTDSLGWAELMDTYIPDSMLAKVHLDGLMATHEGEADYGVRFKYMDSAYKLKGRYPKEGNTTAVQINVDSLRGGYK